MTITRFAAGLAAVLALLVSGCSRFPSAEISGYVKDGAILALVSSTGVPVAGVTGATVRIYLSKPAAADSAGFVATTTTAYNTSLPGYFDRKIMWETSTPAFQEQGDSITIWLGVTHPDFTSQIVEVPGTLSGGQNIVPDILVQRTGFYTAQVTGTITMAASDTVKIGMDFDPASTTETDAYTTNTTCVAGTPAPFVFVNVRWTNTQPSGTGFDQRQVKLWITPTGLPSRQVPGIWLTSGQPTTPVTINLGNITYP